MKKLTTQEFIEKAQKIHGERYDYSKVIYNRACDKVCIICKEHGEFWQIANDHLSACDCPKCADNDKKNLIFGLGVNDCNEKTRVHSYRSWYNIFMRCYNQEGLSKRPTYVGCSVSVEWQKYSNFKKWYASNYVKGWCLDKDLIIKGNKEYHPDKCCYLPNEINTFLANERRNGENASSGVYQMKSGNYAVNVCGKRIGTYTKIEDAKRVYETHRCKRAKELADKWKYQLSQRAYEALYNYGDGCYL